MTHTIFGEVGHPFLQKIYEGVSRSWNSVGNITCKTNYKNGHWQLMFFPAIREISGGQEDGKHVFSGFNLNIGRFSRIFDGPPNVYFNCLRKDFIDHLRFKGTVDGNVVDVAFLPNPPPNQEAVERMYAYGPKKGMVEAI